MIKTKHAAFTMIELVFVIVVLGILAAVAIPRLAATRDDADIAKGRSDVAAIRAGIISERQTRLLRGQTNYAASLEGSDSSVLMENVIKPYGIKAGSSTENGKWRASGSNYIFRVMGTDNSFEYNSTSGTFQCTSGAYCSKLTQ